jgi:hypothetical protein
VRGGLGDGSGIGSAPGDGTVGVARDGGGISVTDVSSGAGLGPTPSAIAACVLPAGSVVATAVELTPLAGAALGAPPGTVAGDRASLRDGMLATGMLGDAGRMLGGGGRMLAELGPALGGIGRMLGGGGRERPRTGGGGGFPDGRESGVEVPPAGRGGNETGRGGCATGRGGKPDGTTTGASPVAAPV